MQPQRHRDHTEKHGENQIHSLRAQLQN